jgi:hypothetical protein
MKLVTKAKSLDMFGQKINLKFGKIGDTFNSPYGIIVSIMISSVVVLYSGIRLNILAK